MLLYHGRVAQRLERLPTVAKTTVRDPSQANGWIPAHCPPSSKWVPSGNTEEIKAAMKVTGHPTSQSRWPRTSVLSNRHVPTYRSYTGHTFLSTTFSYLKIIPTIEKIHQTYLENCPGPMALKYNIVRII